MTSALLGFGVLWKVLTSTGPDVYSIIGEQADVSKPYDASADTVDATHEQSPGGWKEFIPGLKDGGSIEIKLHYIPGGASESQLLGFLGTTQVSRTVFPNGAYVGYSLIVTGVAPDSPIDGKMTLSVKGKISGAVTPVAASAPSNTLEPAIHGSDGTASSGDTLTAGNGVWANEPTSFTYQWKKDGSAISGAVNKTYTVVSGDSTHVITVTVTGVNSAGSASATSLGATIA